MDAIDAALVGRGPVPEILQKYLLATGERGIGFKHVFGDRLATMWEYGHLSYCQQRVLQASDPDGRRDIEIGLSVRELERIEAKEAAGLAPNPTAVFDPERATPEEFEEWMRVNGYS